MSELDEVAVTATETEGKIREAFDANVGNDEEVTKMAMLQAGCKIKAVTRIYNEFLVDSGMMASKSDKDEALEAACKDVDLTDEDIYTGVINDLVESVTGATETSAATMVRSWAKRNEVECWKRPVGSGRKSGFRADFYAALKANPSMTSDEVKDIVEEKGSDNDKRGVTHYQAIRELINAVSGNSLSEAA